MYKKGWYTCRVVVLLIEPIAFLCSRCRRHRSFIRSLTYMYCLQGSFYSSGTSCSKGEWSDPLNKSLSINPVDSSPDTYPLDDLYTVENIDSWKTKASMFTVWSKDLFTFSEKVQCNWSFVWIIGLTTYYSVCHIHNSWIALQMAMLMTVQKLVTCFGTHLMTVPQV